MPRNQTKSMNKLRDPSSSAELAALRTRFARIVLATRSLGGSLCCVRTTPVVPFADNARERARLSDVQNDAAVYFALSQSTENFVDRIEWELLDRRSHFAFGGKGQRFLKIFSCAHDRASESVAT